MITEKDLKEAIAECQGERNPNANTCMKLAAYYTILNNLYPEKQESQHSYSTALSNPVEEKVDYYSDTELSKAVDGKSAADVWNVIEELFEAVKKIAPRLYEAAIQKLDEI